MADPENPLGGGGGAIICNRQTLKPPESSIGTKGRFVLYIS